MASTSYDRGHDNRETSTASNYRMYSTPQANNSHNYDDSCNAVFARLPRSTTNHLDSVLHAAARMIYGRTKHDHITSVLRDELHLLHVPQRVIYKLCHTTYKAINGTAPSYIAAMCVPSSTNQARLRLRSSGYFSRGPKLSSENGPSRMRDLGHGYVLPIALRTSTTLT